MTGVFHCYAYHRIIKQIEKGHTNIAGKQSMMNDNKVTFSVVFAITLGVATFVSLAEESYELGEQGFKPVDAVSSVDMDPEIKAIHQLLADGRYHAAEKAATKLIDDNTNVLVRAEAVMLRAEAKVRQRKYFKSLFDYEYIVRRYPESTQFNSAVISELKIADIFASGVKRKFIGMRILSATGEAEEIYIRTQERCPGSSIAEEAGKKLGDLYYNKLNDKVMAAEAYGLFMELYPNSQWFDYARKRQIDANIGMYRDSNFDSTGLLEAERRLFDYKEADPVAAKKYDCDALIIKVENDLADKALMVAEWYERQDKKVSAQYMYKRVVAKYPNTTAAEYATGRIDRLTKADKR